MHAQINLVRRESLHKPSYKLRREYLGENRSHDHHRCHYSDDDRERFLRIFIPLLRQEAGVNRDEGDRRRAARDDVVQKVGKSKRRNVGVGGPASSIRPCNIGVARISDHTRHHHRADQKQRSRERRVLVRWPEKAQQFRHRDPIRFSILSESQTASVDRLASRTTHVPKQEAATSVP